MPFFLTAQVMKGQPTAIRAGDLQPAHLLLVCALYIEQSLHDKPQTPISGYFMLIYFREMIGEYRT